MRPATVARDEFRPEEPEHLRGVRIGRGGLEGADPDTRPLGGRRGGRRHLGLHLDLGHQFPGLRRGLDAVLLVEVVPEPGIRLERPGSRAGADGFTHQRTAGVFVRRIQRKQGARRPRRRFARLRGQVRGEPLAQAGFDLHPAQVQPAGEQIPGRVDVGEDQAGQSGLRDKGFRRLATVEFGKQGIEVGRHPARVQPDMFAAGLDHVRQARLERLAQREQRLAEVLPGARIGSLFPELAGQRRALRPQARAQGQAAQQPPRRPGWQFQLMPVPRHPQLTGHGEMHPVRVSSHPKSLTPPHPAK